MYTRASSIARCSVFFNVLFQFNVHNDDDDNNNNNNNNNDNNIFIYKS